MEQKSRTKFLPWWDMNALPLDWQSMSLTTRPPHTSHARMVPSCHWWKVFAIWWCF